MEGQRKPKLLRMSEVQEITGLGRATCYAKSGHEWPALKVGRSVRVPLQALEEWIARNTTGGDQQAA